ncbi:MAG TPA: hypothetical protein PLW65_08000 [Pseudomonadota bacterium]|nr:hypothetical protein [Pseudomonadota bacterium]
MTTQRQPRRMSLLVAALWLSLWLSLWLGRPAVAQTVAPSAPGKPAAATSSAPGEPPPAAPAPAVDIPSTPAATSSGSTLPPLSPLGYRIDGSEPGKGVKIPALDIGGLPLAKLLESDNNFSGLGSFKQLLPKYGISTYVHGIAISRFNAQTSIEPDALNVEGYSAQPNFGAEFDLFIGAELANRVFAELQIFYDSNMNRVDIDYGQLDIRIYRDFLFVRGGKFRVPLGNINGYPDPRFTFKLPTLPLFFSQVVPSEWEELGLELYGRYSWGEGKALSYALYVVNGLEQRVVLPGDPITGGAIAQLTNNYLDLNDPDKAVGAQLQVEPIAGLALGLSGYEGVYTVTGQHRIYIVDGHLGLSRSKFTLHGELAATFQQTETDTLLKLGGYLLASYRPIRYLEPAVMFDAFRLQGAPDLDRLAATVGVIVYPFPYKVPSASLRFSYSALWRPSGEFATNRFALQAQVAF